jgi:ribosomal protein S12 methylthiotransferase accessory factor
VSAVHDAIAAYRAMLGPGVLAFPIDGLDRLGVPVWSAGAGRAHGVGYGPTAEIAERGALGETCEVLGALRYAETVHPVLLATTDAVARRAVDPRELSLPLGTAFDPDRPVHWVEAFTWPDREPRLVPLETAVTTLAEFERAGGTAVPPLFPPITNGQGAHTAGDLAAAVRHGLNEVLQRELNWSQFKALDTGRAVDAEAVDPDLVARMRAAGVEPLVKWSGEAFGVHAFHAAAIDHDDDVPAIVRTATGEGADADPRVAARKALTELCSSRSRKRFFFGGDEALAVAPEPYRAAVAAKPPPSEAGWDLIAQFEHLLGDPEALERVVMRITQVREHVALPEPRGLDPVQALRDAGFEVLVVPMTAGDVRVVKVVVPGLECEVLSHHRIGPRARAALDARLGTWDADALRRLAFDFLPLYREPDRHSWACSASPTTRTA